METTRESGSAGHGMPADRHDHAWRKAKAGIPGEHLLVGEYACDLCGAIWAL